jgi:O-antigen/teichoic acid export membrane protein
MKLRGSLIRGVGWTVGAYGVMQLARFAANLALTRILAPELFGIMVLVNSLRTGVDLLLDVGVGQNIIQNKFAEDPDFYNTAWTLQIIRGCAVWIVFCALSIPLARIYQAPILASILPVAGLYFVFNGFSSVGPFLLRRRLALAKINVFEIVITLVSMVVQLAMAYIYPSIWALIFGTLFFSAAMMIGSYFLVPDLKYRFLIARTHVDEIFAFGKWIFVSSILYFLSSNFDRLSLAKLVPLSVLGIYGIARSMSDLLSVLFTRLSDYIIFPLTSSASDMPREKLRARTASLRWRFLLVLAFGISFFAATGDLIVNLLFDHRYHAAGLILPPLVIGVWFSILCAINESSLLGFGKPSFGTVANALKLIYLIVGLQLSFAQYGIMGAAAFIAAADLCRYIPILVGQVKQRFSFAIQDVFLTLAVFSLLAAEEFFRWWLGFGTSLDGFVTGVF